jgi:hypothetical protein
MEVLVTLLAHLLLVLPPVRTELPLQLCAHAIQVAVKHVQLVVGKVAEKLLGKVEFRLVRRATGIGQEQQHDAPVLLRLATFHEPFRLHASNRLVEARHPNIKHVCHFARRQPVTHLEQREHATTTARGVGQGTRCLGMTMAQRTDHVLQFHEFLKRVFVVCHVLSFHF